MNPKRPRNSAYVIYSHVSFTALYPYRQFKVQKFKVQRRKIKDGSKRFTGVRRGSRFKSSTFNVFQTEIRSDRSNRSSGSNPYDGSKSNVQRDADPTPLRRHTSTFREFSKRRNVKPNSTLRQLIREEIDAALKRARPTAATKKPTRRE